MDTVEKTETSGSEQDCGRIRPYEKPSVTRIDLALEETMSKGCKLASDYGCVGPPFAAFDGGS